MAATSILVIGLLMITQAICAPQSGSSVRSRLAPAKTAEEIKGQDLKPPYALSPCARAILGCCNNKVMNSHCSESLKCGAFFFDNNPCDDKYVLEALKAANKFYSQFNKVSWWVCICFNWILKTEGFSFKSMIWVPIYLYDLCELTAECVSSKNNKKQKF